MSETLKKLRMYYRLFGASGLWLGARSRLSRQSHEVTALPIGFTYPVHLRLKGTDVVTLKKIFLDTEYDFPLGKEPKTIIDAGANAGFASIFFAKKYPRAKILALEPAKSNFTLLEKNVRPYPNVLPLLCALWKDNSIIQMVDPGIGDWGFRTHSVGDSRPGDICEQVQGVTVDALMNRHSLDHVDILKVDIEGSEKEVFANAARWIGRIGVVMIELHDRMRVGCTRSVYLATQNFEHESHRGENVLFARKSYTALDDASGRL